MKTRKLISALISIAMMISMLPMTLASAEDLTVNKVVSLGAPAYVNVDGTYQEDTTKLTDGDTETYYNYVGNVNDLPTYVDLGETYAITKVVIERQKGWGTPSEDFELYASKDLYTTSTAVKANADLLKAVTATDAEDLTITLDSAVQGRYVYLVATTLQFIREITVYADTVIKDVVDQVVSLGAPAYVNVDGAYKADKTKLTDGDTTSDSSLYNYIGSGNDLPTYVDLEETYAISKVEIYREQGWGTPGKECELYASEAFYPTITQVKEKADLIKSVTATDAKNLTITLDSIIQARYVYLVPTTAQCVREITVYAKAPRAAAPISATNETKLEAETYAPEFAQAFGAASYTTVSNSYNPPSAVAEWTSSIANSGTWMFAPESSGTKTMSIPVTFAADGVYKVDLHVASYNTFKSDKFANYGVYLTNENGDRVDFGGMIYPEWDHNKATGEHASATALLGYTQAFANSTVDFKAQTGQAYVEAGTYTLNIDFDATQKTIIDYINFEPCAVAQVSKAGTTLQAEDYMVVKTTQNAAADGGVAVYDSWAFAKGKTEIAYTMPINVTETGVYDIETVMTKNMGADTSVITIKVDDEVVYVNDGNGEDVSAENTFVGAFFPMHKYIAPVELTAGNHDVQIVINNAAIEIENSGNYVYKFGLDYVKLAEHVEVVPENSITVKDGTATIKAYYEEGTAGNVFAVFYNGDAIADIARGSFNGTEATITANVTDVTYDSVKVFVWNDQMVPQAGVVNF